MENFRASVQYNDLRGSSAADRADSPQNRADGYLTEKGLISEDEYVVGISMSIGENHGTHTDPVFVTFLLLSLNADKTLPDILKSSDQPLSIKKVICDMSITEFLKLFKRLEITLSTDSLLENKQLEYILND